ncbi:MAG TPA: protein kinase, partial [Thermoanaerobaculia bacterium]
MLRQELLPSGTAVGRYVVEERIGGGGMGEVYRARDSVLGRRVALKILPESLAGDRDRVERFIREARAASSLNHPAIVTVYDSGVAAGVPYLAMELIDGESLAQWSRRNPKKVSEVLAQIADGLSRAHASGLVHRDLKPDNIMVARGGFAKILDFGIAKLIERDRVGTGSSGSRPAEAGLHTDTAPAALLGTAAFMSPEQVERRGVDHRSDVFSFGCLMHAVIEGCSPFERGSSVKTMHAVVNDAAPALNAPLHLQRIARRCLNKDPDERYQSIRDVALDLREKPAETELRPKRTAVWLAAPLLMTGVAGVAIWLLGARSVEAPQITMQRITNSGRVMTGAVSPDGRYAVHATLDGDTESVWVRQIATGTDVRIIPPVDGFYADMKVSPDGNYAFYAYATRSNPNVEDVYEIPMLGGESRKVVDNIDGNFAVSPDGHRIAFQRFHAVERVYRMFVKDLDSGKETVVARARFPKYIGGAPAWAPDGEHLTIVTGIAQDSKALPSIVQLDIRTKQLERINIPPWPFIGTIAWLPDASGMVICASDRRQPSQLWFVPANGKAPAKITSDIAAYGGASVMSDSKTLAAFRAENSVNLWLVPLDRPQDARALTTGLGNFFGTGGVEWLSDREFVYTVYSGESAPSIR